MKNDKRKLKAKLTSEISTQYIKHKGRHYRVTAWGIGETYSITDLTNAGMAGKFCPQATIETISWNGKAKSVWKGLLRQHWPKILDLVSAYNPNTNKIYPEIDKRFNFYIGQYDSKKTMPFDLSIIKPLSREPIKWTLAHVIRALVNDQYKSLVEMEYVGQLKDVTRFHCRDIKDPTDLVTDLIEVPMKRKIYKERGLVIVSLGSNSIRLIPIIQRMI